MKLKILTGFVNFLKNKGTWDMIRLILLSCLLLLKSELWCQTVSIEGHPLLRFLFAADSQTTLVRFFNEGIRIPGATYKEEKLAKTLIRNKKGLFLMVFGTGRVFKVIKVGNDSTHLQRIDSTLFFGNNFNSLDFSFRDTLFSFGGYGFWRFNGQLRYFTEGAEWSIAQLNAENPANSSFFFPDEKKGVLYFIQTPLKQEYTTGSSDKYYLYRLDISSRYVEKAGEIEKPEIFRNLYTSIIVPSLNGLLVLYESKWFLIVPEKNQMFILKNQTVHNWFMLSSTYRPEVFFSAGSKIYSYSRNEDTLRSTEIKITDFSEESFPLYKKPSTFTSSYLIGLAPVIVVLTGIFIYRKRKTVSQTNNGNEFSPEITLVAESETGFTEMEKSLIQTFLTKKGADTYVTVEELNYWLGLSKKSVEIQKKVRREILNKINGKFRDLYKSDTDLIQAERSEQDRRYYNYFISAENAEVYSKIN